MKRNEKKEQLLFLIDKNTSCFNNKMTGIFKSAVMTLMD